MLERPLSAREQRFFERRVEVLGAWLRDAEPAQSVAEDLVGFQLRGLLVDLREALRRKRRTVAIRKNSAAENALLELSLLRTMRERR